MESEYDWKKKCPRLPAPGLCWLSGSPNCTRRGPIFTRPFVVKGHRLESRQSRVFRFRLLQHGDVEVCALRESEKIAISGAGFSDFGWQAEGTSQTQTCQRSEFSGLLIVIGSLLFVCGGAFHPKINSDLGALGSSEFFQNFYKHIVHHGSWRLIHGMILAGPLLWLLGVGTFWSDRIGWTRMANTAMTLAAMV